MGAVTRIMIVPDIGPSRKEAKDAAAQNQLKLKYAIWKKQKYMVAVFRSGTEDLQRNTLDLLAYNKKRCAELAVQREKGTTIPSQGSERKGFRAMFRARNPLLAL